MFLVRSLREVMFLRSNKLENFLYLVMISCSTRIKELNIPDLGATCKCSGRMLVIYRTTRGMHFLCLRCFTKWIKPTMGLYYKANANKRRLKALCATNRSRATY